jgi:hypothetical protein
MTTTILKAASSGLEPLISRADEIRSGQSPDAYLKQRLAQAANALDRSGQLAARVAVANEALAKFTAILYSADADGALPNIDRVTWRIRIPAPWGRSGWRKWELRAWEADVLRSILIERSRQRGGRPELFDYNVRARTWHLNIADYADFQSALFWLKHEAIKLSVWRAHADELSAKAAKRMARNRCTAVRDTA